MNCSLTLVSLYYSISKRAMEKVGGGKDLIYNFFYQRNWPLSLTKMSSPRDRAPFIMWTDTMSVKDRCDVMHEGTVLNCSTIINTQEDLDSFRESNTKYLEI